MMCAAVAVDIVEYHHAVMTRFLRLLRLLLLRLLHNDVTVYLDRVIVVQLLRLLLLLTVC